MSAQPAGSQRSVAREYLEALVIAVLFAVFARTFVVQAFKIPTGSMEENLLVGDHILVNKFIYGTSPTALERALLPVRDPRRGDVVVFKFPEDPARDFIKRCVGLPGDRVEMRDKRLFINGSEVDDASYTYHLDPTIGRDSSGLKGTRDNFGPQTVPEGHYFCLGDNRDFSNDSRFWGSVPAKYVKGRALLVYWSFDHGPQPTEPQSFGERARQLADVALHFFTRTRWDRSFRLVR